MSIQRSKPKKFFKLLIHIIPWFKACNKTNYSNSCELSLLQWKHWYKDNHPIIHFLQECFKACSEELGETAIHTLMMHVRDNNYSGENLAKHWEESRVANFYFSTLPFKRSPVENTTKFYSFLVLDLECRTVCQTFGRLCNELTAKQRLPFKKSNNGYSSYSEKNDSQNCWKNLQKTIANRKVVIANHCLSLGSKLNANLEEVTFANLEFDDLML